MAHKKTYRPKTRKFITFLGIILITSISAPQSSHAFFGGVIDRVGGEIRGAIGGAIGTAIGILANCSPCEGCRTSDCRGGRNAVRDNHQNYRDGIIGYISTESQNIKTWYSNDYFREEIRDTAQRFTAQMTALTMQHAMIIGTFFDGKHQLETQRLFQELQFEAQRDYQPSDDFCWFGTNIRSAAHSEQTGRHNALALSTIQMSRHLGNANIAGAIGVDNDKAARFTNFLGRYCDSRDNGWTVAMPAGGLVMACGAAYARTEEVNIDIDYTRLIDQPRTIDVGFHVPGTSFLQEQDIIALGNNLYGNNILTRALNQTALQTEEGQHVYMALRSVAAKRSVAENSFNAIVGLKSAGTSDSSDLSTPDTWRYLGAALTELGIPADEIYSMTPANPYSGNPDIRGYLGERPSYYAQLEILAKKIYQNPDFYANLYDTKADIKRKSVALKAIELMLDRAIYESKTRQEMVTSVLLSSKLRPKFKMASKDMGGD